MVSYEFKQCHIRFKIKLMVNKILFKVKTIQWLSFNENMFFLFFCLQLNTNTNNYTKVYIFIIVKDKTLIFTKN